MVAYEIAVKPFRVDNLRELEIIRELDDENDYFHREINHDHNFLKLFHSVPSLHSLSIARLDPRLPFPFAQLRSVAIDDSLHDLDLSQVFTLCPAMQNLAYGLCLINIFALPNPFLQIPFTTISVLCH